MRKVNINKMLYIAIFSALIAVSSWISIPSAVPFTMQTFALFFAFMTLGGASGALASAVYIALGIVGLPVFSGFGAGIGAVFGAGGGFIIAFPLSGILYAALERLFGMGRKRKIAYSFISLVLIYACGSLWFSFVYANGTGIIEALTLTVLPFLLPDTVKILLAFYASERVGALINNNRGKSDGKRKDRQDQ